MDDVRFQELERKREGSGLSGAEADELGRLLKDGVFFLSIPSGLVARRQIKRANYVPRGFEIAGWGVGLGILWIACFLIAVWTITSVYQPGA
jgi:hypothetical protein